MVTGICASLLALSLITSGVSANEVLDNEKVEEILVDDTQIVSSDLQNDDTSEKAVDSDSAISEDIRQDIYLLQMSVDSLGVGIDFLCKILLVVCAFLAILVGERIASLFMYWYTK